MNSFFDPNSGEFLLIHWYNDIHLTGELITMYKYIIISISLVFNVAPTHTLVWQNMNLTIR